MDGRSLDLDLTNGGIPCSLGGDPFDTDEAYGGEGILVMERLVEGAGSTMGGQVF